MELYLFVNTFSKGLYIYNTQTTTTFTPAPRNSIPSAFVPGAGGLPPDFYFQSSLIPIKSVCAPGFSSLVRRGSKIFCSGAELQRGFP